MRTMIFAALAVVVFITGCIQPDTSDNGEPIDPNLYEDLGSDYYCIGNIVDPHTEVIKQVIWNWKPEARHIIYPEEIQVKDQDDVPLLKNFKTNETWYVANCSNFLQKYGDKVLVGQIVEGGACDRLRYEITKEDINKRITVRFIYDSADPGTVCTLNVVYHQKWIAIEYLDGYTYHTVLDDRDE